MRLNTQEVHTCKAAYSFFALFIVVGGDAQGPAVSERSVWTMEFIRVRPEKFGLALGYLDDQWMRIREEAKRQGEVLSYHRIQETVLFVAPGSKTGDPNTIVLLTEYKNLAAYSGREKLFASIREHLPNGTPGVLRQQQEDLYEPVGTRMFTEVPDDGRTGLKLLAKQ
jgi:hypothetical protein